MNEYDYSSEILKSEEFNLMRRLQTGNTNVVHENDQVFLNGTFYNYNDESEEMKKYRDSQKEEFIKSISSIIIGRYPNLNEEQVKQIASKCSAHNQEHQEDILLDIDICALLFFEENQLTDETKTCLEKIKENLAKIQNKGFDIEVYSEEYAKYFIMKQFNEHIQNNNAPLLTWGEGRLVAEMNVDFVKQNTSSKVF